MVAQVANHVSARPVNVMAVAVNVGLPVIVLPASAQHFSVPVRQIVHAVMQPDP